jgi:hypothetical protein
MKQRNKIYEIKISGRLFGFCLHLCPHADGHLMTEINRGDD